MIFSGLMHGILTTNRHRAHIDPTVRDECPFCFEHEDVYHLFLQCERLKPMFLLLEEWSKNLKHEFTVNGLFMARSMSIKIEEFMW